MNWLTKLIPSIGANKDPATPISKVPNGLWNNCPACEAILYQPELEKSLFVCPKCDHHLRIGARTRMSYFFDGGIFEELATNITTKDILNFKDTKPYSQRIKEAVALTGEEEAILIGKGKLEGRGIVVAAFEFRYMGGSMGGVVGTKFVHGVDAAIANKVPFVCFSTSGGARMQESMISLMQMAKTAAALEKLKAVKLPYISVMVDPIYGGVSASLAMLGDINIAEPKALVGFAGRRVIEQTVRVDLPEDFQKSEFLLEHGAIDMIVHRKELRQKVFSILSKLYPQSQ
ncbi:MAG: acetyl-CoA carboxylase subunit beta [SAR86 cluster bacterium BACL1 MAG-121001-bin56]|jgi:acetyl-CoA carboxylase carboxyl transferase subunit beta|nr:MAG: acetyl-CoA carboxylase subunit beta [SAR86 cluster bacterium BACL1 MAG-121001-bin56]